MAYEKTIWQGREGEGLDKYLKYGETERSVILINSPEMVTQQGTELSPQNMNHIEGGIEAAHNLIAAEEQARTSGDTNTLAAAKTYTNEKIAATVAATQTWLPAVDTFALLPTITDTSKNWLCRVRNDQTVYQCVAGQTNWTPYSDKTDLVNELELANGISAHNQSETAHADIREALAILTPEGQDNLPERLAGIEAQLAQKAPINATLTNAAGSSTLPATVSTPITTLLQTMRNNLRYVSENKANSSHTHSDYAPKNAPVFTGIPKIQSTEPDPGCPNRPMTVSNPVAAVAATGSPDNTELPVGAYILVWHESTNLPLNRNAYVSANINTRNSPWGYTDISSIRVGDNVIINQPLSGLWRSCGAVDLAYLCRRVA